MKKYGRLLFIILIIILLFIVAFFGTGSSNYETITYKEYQDFNKNGVIYIGSDLDVMKSLKDMDIDNDYILYYLDYSKLSKDEQEDFTDGSIEVVNDGKVEETYRFNSFDLAKGDKKMELEQVDADNYVKLIKEDGLHFMFVGSETCGHCINFKETIKNLYEDYKINIYYIDLSSLDEDGYNKIVNSDSYFSSNEWGTPTSVIYYNGKKIELISGEVDLDTLVKTLNNNIGIKKFLIDNKVM